MAETFDVAAARSAGYSDVEIAQHLGKEKGFNTDAALASGYKPDELIAHMSTREGRASFGGFMQSIKDYVSELNPIKVATGAADTVRALYTDQHTGKVSASAPGQLAQGMAERNLESWHEATDAFHKGNYAAAALHGFNYLVPFGSSLDDMLNDAEKGHIAKSLGKATLFGVQTAAPSSPIVRSALAKIPDIPIPGFKNANTVETAAVDFGKANDIPVNAGMATGNKFVQGVQKAADHTPLGSVVAGAAEKAQADAFGRVGNQLADKIHPTSVSPPEAGRAVTGDIEGTIAKHHAEADRQYSILRDIEADPANVRNVQIGTKEIPYIDEKTGMEIPGKTRTVPNMADVALPVDLLEVKKMLRPIYAQFQRQLPITQMRASTGLKAIENIINGPDAESASIVDRDLSAIKAAARGGDEIPQLATLSQGLAKEAVRRLHDAVSDAVGKAERTAQPGAAPPAGATPKLYHGSPQANLTTLKAGTMMPDDEGWAAGYTTKINPDSSEDFIGRVYSASHNFEQPEYADSLHGAEEKLIQLATATGKPFSSLEEAAKLVHAETGIDGIIAKNKAGKITGAIPLKETPLEPGNSSHPIESLKRTVEAGRPIASNMETAMQRAEKAGAAPAAEPAAPRSAETTVTVPGEPDNVYQGRYEVRELDDVQPSHNGHTFAANPRYGIRNDRNYNNAVNQRKVVDWSTEREFDPAYHTTDNPDATNGPPVIDSEGNVLGGNGRTMILQRVYKGNPKGAAAYRAQLAEKAAQFGIDPAELAGKKQPVLVRVIDDAELTSPEAKQAAVSDFNKVGTAALTPAEQAIMDSRRVSPATMEHVAGKLDAAGESGTLAQIIEGESGREIGHKLIADGVITPQDGAKFITETGLTKAGKERISQLLLGRFFRDPEQIEGLAAAPRNKLERIAAPLVRTEAEGAYNLTPHVQSAVDLIETARAHGSTLDDYLNQSGLFTKQKYSPEAIELAKHLQDTNPVALTEMVRHYAEAAKYAGDYQGPGLFGDAPEPLSPREAFNESFDASLPAKDAAPAPEPAAVPKPSAEFAQAFAPPTPAAAAAPPPRVPGVPAGREAMNALGAGRAATAAKYDAAGVLKSLPRSGEEGKAVFDSAVWRKDGGIEHLRELKRIAPAQIPKIARAYIEQLLDRATTEGGFSKAKGIQGEWLNMGKETKELLFPNPLLREHLDNFFRLAKMASENPNPSGTAVLKVAVGAGTWIIANPATGIPAAIASGVLAKLLHSPAGVDALTAGLRISVANKAAASIAAARILRLVQEASPKPAAPVLAFPQAAQASPPPQQTEQPVLTASR